jgi:outer membrane biosynthesis protein TonB
MKTNNIFRTTMMIMMIIFISGVSAHAGKPAIASATRIQKMIKESITYTDVAVKQGITGSVGVEFTVDDDGKIIIQKTTADNTEVEKLVKDQLALLTCKEAQTTFDQHFWIRITFKLSE